MMSRKKIIEHPEAAIEIVDSVNGKRQITVRPVSFSLSPLDTCIQTDYPLELIEHILKVKGPQSLNDEIRREEDPDYVKICLENELLAYLTKSDFENKRILDFGCGAGASSMILAKLFPEATIIGIELEPKLVELANHRKQYYGLENVIFYCSPDSKTLPPEMGRFDYVILSAVYEHLLPDEREVVLEQIWSLLNPNGIFFLNQTPYRYFPFEGHTTRLFFINYLPEQIAWYYARRCSKRVRSNDTWELLLRSGIRGGSAHEIRSILKKVDSQYRPLILKPSQPGFRDRIDIWYAGYAVTIAKKYPKVRHIQNTLKIVSKIIYCLTGIVFLPTVSLAVRKSV